MKVLVTGSKGRVGAALGNKLKVDITHYDLPEGDCTDYADLKSKMAGHDAVIHLAWNTKQENYDTGEFDPNNILGVHNVYRAAVETGTKRLIMISSVHTHKFENRGPDAPLLKPFDLPLPDSPYGASKCFVESLGRHYAEKYGLEVICIRLGGVNAADVPPESPASERRVWLSHRDLSDLMQACLQAAEVPYNYTILYAVSNNEGRLHDVMNPFGWMPKDGAALKDEQAVTASGPTATPLFTPITEIPVPKLYKEQLSRFSFESIHAEQVTDFNPDKALETLRLKEGSRVIGADFGGDKGLTQLYVIRGGQLQPDDAYKDYVQSTHGDGYLESMEKTARFATEHDIPVGISWGAPLDGTRPLYHPKAEHFLKELQEKYDNDFSNVLPTLKVCINDGSAGLISGIVEVCRTKKVESVLFPINGGGLGMAALVRNGIYSTEAGHVEAVPELNTYGQDIECGVYGATYICLEKLGANKSGIEAQWEARNGYMRARDIEDQFKAGNAFAGELYDHSALVVAHMIVGTAKALDIDLALDTTAIVAHGGAFKFPNYGERVQQIIEKHTGKAPYLLMTQNYGSKETNACLDGAALAAAIDY